MQASELFSHVYSNVDLPVESINTTELTEALVRIRQYPITPVYCKKSHRKGLILSAEGKQNVLIFQRYGKGVKREHQRVQATTQEPISLSKDIVLELSELIEIFKLYNVYDTVCQMEVSWR